MDFMGGISSVISILSFTIFAAGVMKVFQMATTLSEIKDVLTAIKLNCSPSIPVSGRRWSRHSGAPGNSLSADPAKKCFGPP